MKKIARTGPQAGPRGDRAIVGGAGKWREEYCEPLHGKRVAVIADADRARKGGEHTQQVAASLLRQGFNRKKSLELPGAKDLTEWIEHGGTRDALLELIRNAPEHRPEPATVRPSLISVSITELLEREIKPREMLLDPILPEQGLVMLYSYRGLGKTFLSLGIAAAVWQAEANFCAGTRRARVECSTWTASFQPKPYRNESRWSLWVSKAMNPLPMRSESSRRTFKNGPFQTFRHWKGRG